MLDKYVVAKDEERLRRDVASLPDPQRKRFYELVQRPIRDPDTYAVLNYAFIAGVHPSTSAAGNGGWWISRDFSSVSA